MIVITGGTGFMGRHLCAALEKAGIQHRALNRRGLECGRSFDDASVIVHMAGGPDPSTNLHATSSALSHASRSGVSSFVHVSTLDILTDPESAYSRSKALSEAAVAASGLPYCIVRPSLVYGPNDHFVTPLIRLLTHMPAVPLPAGGIRTPLFIDDLIHRLIGLCTGSRAQAELNISGPDALDVRGMAEVVRDALGLRRVFLPVPRLALAMMSPFSKPARFLLAGAHDKALPSHRSNITLGSTGFAEGARQTAIRLGIITKPTTA